MSNRPSDKGRPRIPSNLRIRRGTSYNAAVVARDTLDDAEGSFNPENRRGSDGNLVGGIESLRMSPTNFERNGDSIGRQSGFRSLGVIEQLAREDRLANASRRQNFPNSGDQESVLFRLRSSNNNPASSAKSTPPSSLSPSDSPPRERPALTTRLSGNLLPTVAEVTSPTEAADGDTKSSIVKGKSDVQNKEDEYFSQGTNGASSSSKGKNLGETPASITSRPPLPTSLSVPAERYEKSANPANVSKDDTLVQDGGGRLTRMPSNLPKPSPLTEELLNQSQDELHHEAEVADYLDVIDAEVGTLSYLTNVQNSIFIPNIPFLYDRRPVHDLPGSRRRSSTITSLAKRATGRRSSLIETGSQDHRSVRSDLEQGRTSVLGSVRAGYTGGEKPTKTATRASIVNRVTSAVGITKKNATDEEEEAEFAKHIKEWRYMDEEERDELDEHVRLVLSKKSKFRRGLKGFWAFVKTPMGFIMTLYGFLITFWGTAIMLFIWHWIHAGERRRYWIEICDQILCALFAAVGLGFAPFRAVDTYRMIWIAKMHYRTWERRKKLGLTDLQDKNDLPRPDDDNSNQVSRVYSTQQVPTHQSTFNHSQTDVESEAGRTPSTEVQNKHWWSLKHDPTPSPGQSNTLLTPQSSHSSTSKNKKSKHKGKGHYVVPIREEKESTNEGESTDGENRPVLKRNDSIQSELVKEREDIVVLTKEEQALLEHHQRKFHASHTFYRFHETSTHRAFPLDLMITIVCLLDCHSIFQGALGGVTWGIKYTHRPTALTATLITCSLSCNAVAGLLIYIGGRKTKKREEVERRLKIALEAMALAKIERRRARGELPERHADGSKGSSTPKGENEEGSFEKENKDPDEKELRQAVDIAASQTQEEDQAPYDETEEERQHTLFGGKHSSLAEVKEEQ